MTSPALVLTCEHGGNRVPAPYARLFETKRAQRALASHRGYDLGALGLAEALARRLDIELDSCTVTRLLVDLNRSIGHRALFCEFSRALDAVARERLLEAHYFPYRRGVHERIARLIGSGRSVVHVSVHSFVPRLGGVTRNADVGLLYDSTRRRERAFCEYWQRVLGRHAPALHVRRNYPYRGAADGLTTALRRALATDDYIGIELEANQALLSRAPASRRALESALAATLASAIGACGHRTLV